MRFARIGLTLRRLFNYPVIRSLAFSVGVVATGITIKNSQEYTPRFITLCEEKKGGTVTSYRAPRIKLRNELMRTLSPVKSLKGFAVVYGEDGSGKTTMVREFLRDLESDAVYFDIPARVQDTKYWDLSADSKEIEDGLSAVLSSSGSIESSILHATQAYYDTNHRPMLLVLDSIENLYPHHDLLKRFLRVAKECADKGTAKIVFVCNDSAINMLQRDILWSFAEPIEVPELSELEATQYLSARKVTSEVAKEAVLTLTGGNLQLLERFVECNSRKNQSLESIQKEWYRELIRDLEDEDGQISLSNYQQGLRLLTDKKSVSVREALDYFSPADLRRLVDHRVLSYHSGARFLRLRGKLVEKYFAEKFGKT